MRPLRRENATGPGDLVTTRIPARLERLPWGRFHTLVVAALGMTWILDGLEVTLAGSVAGALKTSPALRFTDPEVGLSGSAYLIGAVAGALLFGWLTDRMGRKKLFFVTIGGLSRCDGCDGSRLERGFLLSVPIPDRRGNRRRICGDQFDHPGTDSGPLPRPARSGDQRQLLARRGARSAGGGGAPEPVALSGGPRMAPGFSDRRASGLNCLCDAHVDPRKPALACDPRTRKRR